MSRKDVDPFGYREVWRRDALERRLSWLPILLVWVALLVLGVLTVWAEAAAAGPSQLTTHNSVRRLLDAIRHVESGGDPTVVGDGGKAIGPYQVHRDWWIDSGGSARSYRTGALDRATVEARIVAMWRKRCPRALASGDLETLARTFRRPVNPWHSDNAAYWRRVKEAMR